MKSSHRRSMLVLHLVAAAAWTSSARAQGAGAPPPGEPPPPPAPVPVPQYVPVPPPSPVAAPAAAPAPTAPKWYEKAKIEGFVDTYANLNFNMPKPQTGGNLGRSFDVSNGFAMHWAGLNASYAPDPVGGTVALRFGPGAFLYNGAAESGIGLGNVKEAYASWKPGGGPIQIDVGKFSTWIGGEVADSQYNLNYTRSALFFTQPLFHTGLRLDYQVNEQLDLKVYAVNGWNNSQDNNSGKTFGATVGITPAKEFALYLNYIGGPETTDYATTTVMGITTTSVVPDANSSWRHLVDVVADVKLDKARVLVNADYGTDKTPGGASSSWFGGNLSLGYAVSEFFAIAARGGYLSDPDGFQALYFGAVPGVKSSVIDGTLTLSMTPTPNLIIKLEPRIDSVSSDAPGWEGGFPKAPDATPAFSKTMFTTLLGVVVTTN